MVENQTELTEEVVDSPTTEESLEETVAEEPSTKPVEESAKEETDQERNFRELRESKKRAERETEFYRQELESIKKEIQSLKPKPEPEPEEDFGIQDDSLVEGKQLKAILREIKEQKKQLQSYRTMSAETKAEVKLKDKYKDFDAVVNEENIQKLKELYPDVAQSLVHTPDLYTKGSSAYTFIKNLGIAQSKTYENDRERALSNTSKPRPLVAGGAQQGQTPLSQANAFAENGGHLTEEMKQREYAEMQRITSGWNDKDIW